MQNIPVNERAADALFLGREERQMRQTANTPGMGGVAEPIAIRCSGEGLRCYRPLYHHPALKPTLIIPAGIEIIGMDLLPCKNRQDQDQNADDERTEESDIETCA